MVKDPQEFREHLHFDSDIEKALLGVCLLEKNAYGSIRGIVDKNCFYYDSHRAVFEAIDAMWTSNLPIDILTVVNYIGRSRAALPGVDFLGRFVSQLTNAVVSGTNVQYHAFKVKEMFLEREIVRIRHSTSPMDMDGLGKLLALQKEIEKAISVNVSYDWTDMDENVVELMKHMAKVEDLDIIGAPTGFSEIDLITSGFQEGTLTVIGARPSVGKTAFLVGMIIHQAGLKIPVGVVSLETPRLRITARMASNLSNIDFFKFYRNRFRDEAERAEAHSFLALLATLPVYISDNVDVTIDDIRAKVAHLIHKHGCKIIYIDYLQLVDTDESNKNTNREQQISRISRGCKKLSMEFHIPVILLAQLNREVEKSADKKPQLHHLRESGSIEQDADNVMFLHRDAKVGILLDEHGNSTERHGDVIIAKWRDGETRTFKIGFDGPKMKFHDLHEGETVYQHTRQNPWAGNNRLPHADD